MNEFFANFRRVDEEFFEELEEMLILSDVGVNVATQLTEDLRYEARLENVKKLRFATLDYRKTCGHL